VFSIDEQYLFESAKILLFFKISKKKYFFVKEKDKGIAEKENGKIQLVFAVSQMITDV